MDIFLNNKTVFLCDECYDKIHNTQNDIEVYTSDLNLGRVPCVLCENVGKHMTSLNAVLHLFGKILTDYSHMFDRTLF